MQVPDLWKELLEKIQEHQYLAVIAGGCLRDLDHGKEISDVDIFVPQLPTLEFTARGTHVQDIPELVVVKEGNFYWMRQSQGANRVLKCEYKGIAVDIVEMLGIDNLWHVINRFDYGLNRIAYDGDRIYTSEYYEHDKKNKTFTMRVCNDMSHFKFMLDKYENRIKVKYPEYKLVIGDKFKDYELRYSESLLDGSEQRNSHD